MSRYSNSWNRYHTLDIRMWSRDTTATTWCVDVMCMHAHPLMVVVCRAAAYYYIHCTQHQEMHTDTQSNITTTCRGGDTPTMDSTGSMKWSRDTTAPRCDVVYHVYVYVLQEMYYILTWDVVCVCTLYHTHTPTVYMCMCSCSTTTCLRIA